MDLKQYEQKKFALAEIIRSAQAVDPEDGTLLSGCRELLTRLAEDRFNLMVVGRFSRGKSTLMNAILGGDHLPTGIVPLTSVITTVRYGSRKQVVLHFTDLGLSHEVPLSQLADYVTQKSNPGNVKRISYAEIQLQLEILRRGLHFVDSPGLGSPIVENTLTTERFIREADAFVLVTSYESPLSEEEDRILHRIRNANKKLFIVVNKQDTVPIADREDALRFVAERIQQFRFLDVPPVFSISARQGLEAKQSEDVARLEESGVPSFEGELSRFLFQERAQSFLVNMYQRTMSFLAQMSTSQASANHEDPYRMLISRLRDLRETVLGSSERLEDAVTVEHGATKGTFILQLDSKTGCKVCGLVLETIFHFLSKYQYELTINPETQQEHARRGGFCPLHTWQYEGISSPQGVCEAYPRLVHRLAGHLREVGLGDTHPLLRTTRGCRICEVQIEAEKQAVHDVVAVIEQVAGSDNGQVPASCLPHLRMVVVLLRDGETVQRLLNSHANLLERTAEDLQRYAIKHDALRRYLTSEEERRASHLALLLLAGHRNISSPWAVEYIL